MSALNGVGVAVTRPGRGPGRLGELIRAAGGSVVHWPCIRFADPENPSRMRRAVARGDEFDWVVLSSPRAARRWLAALAETSFPTGPTPAIAVVGPATARVVRDAGRDPAVTAEEYSGAGLVETLAAATPLAGARVLFPAADRASDVIPRGLERYGAAVERVVAYRTLVTPPDPSVVREAVDADRVHVVAFASPSAVDGFLGGFADSASFDPRERLRAAAIGPTTGAALRAHGWPATVADEASLDDLVAACAGAASALTLSERE